MTVILDPYVTAQFPGIIGSTLSGKLCLKEDRFADRDGDQVAPNFLTLIDDPTDIDAFTATEADGEGLASRKNTLIDRGKVCVDFFIILTLRERSGRHQPVRLFEVITARQGQGH